MLHELGDDRFGLQIVISIVIVAFVAYGAVEALDDDVRFGVLRLRLDIDQVLRRDFRDHGAHPFHFRLVPRFRIIFTRRTLRIAVSAPPPSRPGLPPAIDKTPRAPGRAVGTPRSPSRRPDTPRAKS